MLGIEAENETAEWLRSTFVEDSASDKERDAYWFVIADPQNGSPIGEIGLVEIRPAHRRCGLSIHVLPGLRRAGVGREAIEVLLAWAHSELGLHRVELHTLPENLPMQRLAEATGFVRDGVLRDYRFERGRFTDNVVYSQLLE